ncbi:LPXTG cell wall anchor domain-containing protein [Streptococcus gallolyticus]|nr:LPXTG cell wall anchor domain-containing protein [Streptococcus gallolyticus]MBY5041312.1 LPXTG cell wall anchor domain-containing protein [Streptococcus gallolyticus]
MSEHLPETGERHNSLMRLVGLIGMLLLGWVFPRKIKNLLHFPQKNKKNVLFPIALPEKLV